MGLIDSLRLRSSVCFPGYARAILARKLSKSLHAIVGRSLMSAYLYLVIGEHRVDAAVQHRRAAKRTQRTEDERGSWNPAAD